MSFPLGYHPFCSTPCLLNTNLLLPSGFRWAYSSHPADPPFTLFHYLFSVAEDMQGFICESDNLLEVQEGCTFLVPQPAGKGRGQHEAGSLEQKEAAPSETSRENPRGRVPQWTLSLYTNKV